MAQIQSGASSDLLTIDPTSKAARVSIYDANGNIAVYDANDAPTTPAGILVMGMNDSNVIPLRSDRTGALATAMHTQLFYDNFEGSTIHALRWFTAATTYTVTQSTVNGITLNAGSSVAASAGYLVQTAKKFPVMQRSPLMVRFRARMVHFNNAVMELGFGDSSSSTAAHTTAAMWVRTTTGALVPIVTFNSSDQTGSDISSLVTSSNYYTYDIIRDDDSVTFTCQDTSTGLIISKQVIRLPLTAQRTFSATSLSAHARVYSTSAPATAPQLFLTDVYVSLLDNATNKPWPHVVASQERGAANHPFTGVQNAQYANSGEPASATLSNTAAGYTTLGGKFQFAAVAGAVTDYALFAFTVPAGINMTVTGIDIETWNTGAAVATTPTLLTWAIAANSTAVSLATAGLTRIALGAQDMPVGSAIGFLADRISKTFQTPLYTTSGRIFHVILRMPVGTATGSQVIAGMVNIDAYFD